MELIFKRYNSSPVSVFFQAALRKIAAVRQKEEFKKLGAQELVESRLWDAFVAHSSKRESYVQFQTNLYKKAKIKYKNCCLVSFQHYSLPYALENAIIHQDFSMFIILIMFGNYIKTVLKGAV